MSSGRGPCDPSCSSSCVGMFGLQDFFEVRVVGLDEGTGFEMGAEDGHPEAGQGDGYGDVLEDAEGEVKIAGGVLEVGLDQPEEVEGLGEDHPLAHAHEALLVAL